MHHTGEKKRVKKKNQKKGGGGVMRNLLPGDSNLNFPNQLELKVNGSINSTHWTTSEIAANAILKQVHIPSLW